ncbi:TRAP transporter small permease subunit [Primorskyibacter sp. S187A]|uniref:TRAP transporter small permease subunit n=1 Tax=Primorskyibacter sp. S187A TaxID=3415130 RepID=UPI003C7B3168
MEEKTGSLIEWLVPLAFLVCAGWAIWHMPAFILDFGWQTDESQRANLEGVFLRNDVSPGMGGLFGGFSDIIDWLSVLGIVLFGALGVMTVRRAAMEHESFSVFDRLAVFIGRLTMMLIVLLTSVMLYEVILRYVFEAPTLWANELSLWLAGFVFLTAGLYAMQQRSHIRIVLLYDVCPRWIQRIFDVISTTCICLFAFFLIYGGYGEAFTKFYRWETFGTAFDPPIPATIKISVLFIVGLVALQAVVNLIADWNKEQIVHGPDEPDAEELAALRAAVGADGTGDLDVTRAAALNEKKKD